MLAGSPAATQGSNPLAVGSGRSFVNALVGGSGAPLTPASAVMPPTSPSGVQPTPQAAQQGMQAATPPPGRLEQLVQALGSLQLPAAKLTQLADAEDHVVQATGALLQQKEPITQQDLNDAFGRAKARGNIDENTVQQFAKGLPSVSNQTALRSALAAQRVKSIQTLVAFHTDAQSRGVGLSAVHGPAPASAPGKAGSFTQ